MILENLNVAISNNFISPFPPPPLQSHDRFHTRPTRIVFRCHKIIGIPHYITRDYGCIIIIRGKVGGQAGKLKNGRRPRLSFTRFNDRVPKLNNRPIRSRGDGPESSRGIGRGDGRSCRNRRNLQSLACTTHASEYAEGEGIEKGIKK